MPDLPTKILRLADLGARKPTTFALAPDDAERAALTAALDLLGLRKFSFAGEIAPLGGRDWQLTARLGATVVQPCVVTLDPVTTRIDEDVTRTYLADYEVDTAAEVEMPEDDTREPLPATLDIYTVALEALSLALPPFPRAPGATLGEAVFTAPGAAPMTDEAARPFAGLQGLRDQLKDDT